MWFKLTILPTISCVITRPTFACDAVAIGYSYDGVWTAVTYNRSSTRRAVFITTMRPKRALSPCATCTSEPAKIW